MRCIHGVCMHVCFALYHCLNCSRHVHMEGARSFVSVTWQDSNNVTVGREMTELSPAEYRMDSDGGRLKLTLTTSTQDKITFYIKELVTCKKRRGKCKISVQWKMQTLTYTLYTTNSHFLEDINTFSACCKITAVQDLT